MLDELRKIGAAIGWTRRRSGASRATWIEALADAYNFLGRTFKVGPPGETSFVNENDLKENLRQVRNARAFADKVIVSLHCHDLGGPTLLTAKRRTEIDDLADYAVDFGRRSIDAGADIFVCHGPQVPMGVELYRGKPMLHGIGTFIFQIETMRYLPAEAYQRYGLDDRATPADFIAARYQGETLGHAADPVQWEQMFSMCEFSGDDLAALRLYPIDLGHQRPRTGRGRPMLADQVMADRILAGVARRSARYGTRIERQYGIGVVQV